MNSNHLFRLFFCIVATAAALNAHGQTTVFTYQGRLTDAGAPANGNYDLQFGLRDAVTSGNPVGSSIAVAPVAVTNGLFTVQLDFGASAFPGAGRWLEISVRTNGALSAYTVLAPRQAVTSAPYAIQALNAATASGLSGALASGQLSGTYASPLTLNNAGNSFTGNGGGLTSLNASQLSGGTVPAAALGNAWLRGGNSGTTPGTDFVGTTDNQALEFKVNGSRALRLEPNATSPNVIGGYSGNYLAAGLAGATISGGGFNGKTNSIFADYSTIGGGYLNTIQPYAIESTIGGGSYNTIQLYASSATIGGGLQNSIQTSSYFTTIGGGFQNSIQANSYDSTVGGGANNIILAGSDSTIGGGFYNNIQSAVYSTIGGGSFNTIQTNASISTIAGGDSNLIQSNANDSTIGGGFNNVIQTSAIAATIGGGGGNVIQINASSATIGGGSGNVIQTNAFDATISGGYGNVIQTNAYYSAIGGGNQNLIQAGADNATIGGGQQNTIQPNAHSSSIGGGANNIIQPHADESAIGGGFNNIIQTFAYVSTIGGGNQNIMQNSAYASTIGGGDSNVILTNANYCMIGGGHQNTIQPSATAATIGGGASNNIQTYAAYAMIPGGRQNVAASYALAAGYNALATNNGAFVWSDSTGTLTGSQADNSVTMRASGGFTFLTGTGSVGASLAAGGTSWATISDRNAKKNFQPVDSADVLEKLAAIPVQHWNYKWEPNDAVPHLGPVAQDFKAAFYPGRDDKSITTLEFDGVELAAIQGLNQKLELQKTELAARQQQILALEKRLANLEKLVQSTIK